MTTKSSIEIQNDLNDLNYQEMFSLVANNLSNNTPFSADSFYAPSQFGGNFHWTSSSYQDPIAMQIDQSNIETKLQLDQQIFYFNS